MEWTDKRMDDLAERMDAGFARVDGEIKDLRGDMNAGFERVHLEMAEMRSMMFRFVVTTFAGAFALITALIAVIAAGSLSA